MKIENRVRLLKALEPTTTAVKRNGLENSGVQSGGDKSAAVKVTSNFNSKITETDNSSKVAELKAQVQAGTYSAESGAVSESIIKELGVL